MSDGQRPPRRPRRPPNVLKPPTKPKGFEDVPELSDEEVERRVAVTGGGAPREPVQRPVRRLPPPPKERTVARDSLLLIGLVIVGLVAVAFLLPNGPLTASATNPPGSEAAVATMSPTRAPTPAPTSTLAVVDQPSSSPAATATDVPSVGPTVAPTVAPIPTPTLRPGETPRPTPKVTPVPTPKPTPPPGSPTMTVIVNVVNDDGGTAVPSSWLFSPNGANASPTSFLGSSSGTLVTLQAGVPYQIDSVAQDSEGVGYTAVQSSHCGSGTGGLLQDGEHVTCTITKNDEPVQVKVTTHVNGPDAASQWDVSVTASGVTPSGSVGGSETGTVFKFDAHAPFSVVDAGPAGYDPPDVSGMCTDGAGFVPGTHLTCTYTFNQTPPPTDPPPTVPMLVFLALPLPRRWRLIRR